MASKFGTWWQKIKQHPFIVVGIVIALLAIIAFTMAVHLFGWDWTGFTGGVSKTTVTSTPQGKTTATEMQPARSLWDWLGLLAALAIPVVVGLGAAWFTMKQAQVSDRENSDNQREKALQDYIDKMSELLLKEHLSERTADGQLKSEYDQARNVARVRTITVLTQLNARRVGYAFAFLREAGLMSISSDNNVVSLRDADLFKVNWSGANLREVDLKGAHLSGANLSEAVLFKANLSEANLSEANLSEANLSKANLSEANLSEANLSEANLSEANLSEANLSEANLSEANLSKANLSGVAFSGVDLKGADLSGVDLSGAHLRGRHR